MIWPFKNQQALCSSLRRKKSSRTTSPNGTFSIVNPRPRRWHCIFLSWLLENSAGPAGKCCIKLNAFFLCCVRSYKLKVSCCFVTRGSRSCQTSSPWLYPIASLKKKKKNTGTLGSSLTWPLSCARRFRCCFCVTQWNPAGKCWGDTATSRSLFLFFSPGAGSSVQRCLLAET